MRQQEMIAAFFLVLFASHQVTGFLLAPQRKLAGLSCRRHQSTVDDVAETTPRPAADNKGEATTIPWPLDTEKYGEFNQERDWGFAYSSTPPEACSSYVIDDVEGDIPADLAGTYYKTGPGNFEREGRRYEHVLDGDGFVSAFKFRDGKARYTGRFVETEYYLQEQASGKIEYRSVFGTQRTGGVLANAFDLTLKNPANTNVLEWGGRLFAFFEAGRPYEIDPDTLETLSQTNDGPFKGLEGDVCNLRGITIDEGGPIDQFIKVGRSFTAHPHILDDDTMVAFMSTTSVKNKEAILEFIEYDKNWQKKNIVEFAFPKGPPPHDFSVSDNYYAFFENPFGPMDNNPYVFGVKGPAQIMQLLLRQPTILNLVPRTPGRKPLKFKVPPYFNIHAVAQSEEREGKLYLHSNGWDLHDERYFPKSADSVPFLGSWGGLYPDFVKGIVPPGLMYRTVLDLESEEVTSHEEVCPGNVVEFLSQDERDPHKVYCSIATTDYSPMPGTGLCHYDLKTAAVKYWWTENRVFTGEVVPVAKQNGLPGSWLLSLLYDAEKRRTSLVILDSEEFEQGPICRLHLKHHLSYGLHGSFSPLNI